MQAVLQVCATGPSIILYHGHSIKQEGREDPPTWTVFPAHLPGEHLLISHLKSRLSNLDAFPHYPHPYPRHNGLFTLLYS